MIGAPSADLESCSGKLVVEREADSATREAEIDQPRQRRRRVRKILLLGVWLLLACLLAWYARYYFTIGRFIETTQDAYVGGNVTDIAARVSGQIAAVSVTDNQFVHKGDMLVKLDNRDSLVALERSRAAVAADEASVTNLTAQAALQTDLIAQAQADLKAAIAQQNFTADTQTRYKHLASTNAVSVQDLQNAEDAFNRAQAACDRARAAVAAAKAQMPVIASERAEKEAALDEAHAAVDAAQLNVSYTEIRAPFDGVVGNRSAHTGGYAFAGAQLLTIVPANGLWVDANFKENQLARLRPGMKVRIVPDIDTSVIITGRIDSLSPASGAVFSLLPAENATGNFTKIVQRVPVRIILPGDYATLGLLRPGLSVTATVNTK